MGRHGLGRTGVGWKGLERIGVDRNGLKCIGVDWIKMDLNASERIDVD